jgi:hypothetical protein
MDSNGSTYNFTNSNSILSVGFNIIVLIVIIVIMYFGEPTTPYQANSVRKMVESRILSNSNRAANKK